MVFGDALSEDMTPPPSLAHFASDEILSGLNAANAAQWSLGGCGVAGWRDYLAAAEVEWSLAATEGHVCHRSSKEQGRLSGASAKKCAGNSSARAADVSWSRENCGAAYSRMRGVCTT